MMKRNGWLAAIALTCAQGLWAGDPGVRPRFDAHSYPASAPLAQGTVAAAALSRTEVHDNFSADLNRGYLVFEVAFYPNPAGGMKISPTDFMLKVTQQNDTIRPSEPAVAARAIDEKSGPKRVGTGGIAVYPVATIGYETGIDNANGNGANGQRHSGVYSSVGVAVAGSAGGGNPNGPDRYSMEAELFDKSLPEGPITKPTAGYLYFPAPKTKQKPGVTYQLQYVGEASTVKLAVPVPHEK